MLATPMYKCAIVLLNLFLHCRSTLMMHRCAAWLTGTPGPWSPRHINIPAEADGATFRAGRSRPMQSAARR